MHSPRDRNRWIWFIEFNSRSLYSFKAFLCLLPSIRMEEIKDLDLCFGASSDGERMHHRRLFPTRGQHSLYVKNIFSVWCSLKFLHFIASFLSFLVFSASRQFTARREEEGKSITNRECPVNALCSMACFLCIAVMRALIFDNASSCNKRVEEPPVRSVSMWMNCG